MCVQYILKVLYRESWEILVVGNGWRCWKWESQFLRKLAIIVINFFSVSSPLIWSRKARPLGVSSYSLLCDARLCECIKWISWASWVSHHRHHHQLNRINCSHSSHVQTSIIILFRLCRRMANSYIAILFTYSRTRELLWKATTVHSISTLPLC